MAQELRKAGWTVIEPEPAEVIDEDGDSWIKRPDGTYRLLDSKVEPHTLAEIELRFGIKEQA